LKHFVSSCGGGEKLWELLNTEFVPRECCPDHRFKLDLASGLKVDKQCSGEFLSIRALGSRRADGEYLDETTQDFERALLRESTHKESELLRVPVAEPGGAFQDKLSHSCAIHEA